MSIFETSTIVEPSGRIHLTDLPFEPGTEVAVVISSKAHTFHSDVNDSAIDASRLRLRQLFQAVKGFRNSPKITRDDLYDSRSIS